MWYQELQKVDAIVDVRKKVVSTYSIVEDRLTAVNILVNHMVGTIGESTSTKTQGSGGFGCS